MAGKHCVHDDSSYIKWLVCVVYGMVWYGGGLLLCLSGTYGGCVCVCVCVLLLYYFFVLNKYKYRREQTGKTTQRLFLGRFC